jgi:ubiquitin-protein ligase
MSGTAINERREQDVRKLGELAKSSSGKIEITKTSGNPINKIEIELGYKTAPNKKYPAEVSKKTKVLIELPSRYPFQEPKAVIKTKIFHPNVYSNGTICFGTKWLPTEGLDLLVKRIAQIITFDTSILNESSPANPDALKWYRKIGSSHSDAFPTEKVSFSGQTKKKTMSWTDVSSGAKQKPGTSKTVVKCPSCGGSLRVPKGKSGKIRCPSCSKLFEAKT